MYKTPQLQIQPRAIGRQQVATPQGPNPMAMSNGGGGELGMVEYANSQYPGYSGVYDPSSMSMYGQVSGWAPLARQAMNLKRSEAIDKGVHQSAATAAKARSELASRGGLSSGARERVAEGGQNNYMDMMQGLAREGMDNELQIGVQDQENKMKAKGMDVENTLKENQNKNDYNMRAYEARMQAMAAERQAQATENSGKGK